MCYRLAYLQNVSVTTHVANAEVELAAGPVVRGRA